VLHKKGGEGDVVCLQWLPAEAAIAEASNFGRRLLVRGLLEIPDNSLPQESADLARVIPAQKQIKEKGM